MMKSSAVSDDLPTRSSTRGAPLRTSTLPGSTPSAAASSWSQSWSRQTAVRAGGTSRGGASAAVPGRLSSSPGPLATSAMRPSWSVTVASLHQMWVIVRTWPASAWPAAATSRFSTQSFLGPPPLRTVVFLPAAGSS